MNTFHLKTDTGTLEGALLPGGGEAFEVRLRNGGLPDNWGWSKTPTRSWGWTPGPPICFSQWEVVVDEGLTLLAGGMYGARHDSQSWKLATPSDWKVPAKRSGVDLWPGTETYHRVFPGDTLYARFVPADDPFELRYQAKEITPQRRAHALQIMGFNEGAIARWPWLKKILNLYRYDASSINPNTPPGYRNCGWLLVPKCFMKRWPNYGGGMASLAHWYGLGSRSAVGAENLVNEHYDPPAAWIGRGLRDYDPVAVTCGMYLLRHKIAYGLIDCDDTSNWMWGKWRNEKGDVARGTTGMAPSPAKEYDKSLAMASVLFPDEPMIARAAKIRQDHLLGWKDHAWTGSGGTRNLGHFLENLRHWWIATGNDAFKDKAAAEITFALSVVGALPYIPENRVTGQVCAGEGISALAAMVWWERQEAVNQHSTKIAALQDWHIANGFNHATGQTPYEVYANPDGTIKKMVWNGTFQGCNWLQVPGLYPYSTLIEGCMFTKYANNADCDAAFGGEGPGWEKWLPWIVNWGACDL